MAKEKLTVPLVKQIEPTGKIELYFDSELPCFALRVFPSGFKSFVIKYRNENGQQRLFTVGSAKVLTLDQARKLAREHLQDVEHGGDPAKQKKADKEVLTVSELCDLYLQKGLGEKKPSTIMNDKSRIENHIKPLIGREIITNLKRSQVEDMMLDIANGKKIAVEKKGDKPRGKITIRGGRDAAARTTQLLGAILQFAVRRELIEKNPARDIRKAPAKRREEHLTTDDLRPLGIILNDPKINATNKTATDAIKLLLMTGCRKSELLTLKWKDIDFDRQTFHFQDTKTGKQDRAFGVAALNLLREQAGKKVSDWVFPSNIDPNKHMTGLLLVFKKLQQTKDDNGNQIFTKPNIGLHTLRHSFASIARNELNFDRLTIAGLMGHKLIRSATDIYIHTVDKVQIQAADTLSIHIASALNNTEHKAKVFNIAKKVA